MSRSLESVALHAAVKTGCPCVHIRGNEVALVLYTRVDTLSSQVTGHVQVVRCASAGLARSVAARALGDLDSFRHLMGQSLTASLMYAEAALRHARRRARREQ